MTFDLRTEHWLPLRRRSGSVEWVSPAHITRDLATDPYVAIASPRPDFDGAVTEFLIGLLTAALDPPDEAAWRRLWDAPPSEHELGKALDRLPAAFDLQGARVAFLQDLAKADFAGKKALRPEQLLLDAPGEQTLDFNKDIFVKRGRVPVMGRPAAAMALLALQAYAPKGGSGHRVSLRGSGPLTTLVDPRVVVTSGVQVTDARDALWRLVWVNVLPAADRPREHTGISDQSRFPWLGLTRVSNGTPPVETLPNHGHAVQAFFAMPRRVRLVFDNATSVCALTGHKDEHPVIGFRALGHGIKYRNWRHPLSPYRRLEKEKTWQAYRGQYAGIGWRDWLGFNIGETDRAAPAEVVTHFRHRRWSVPGVDAARIAVFGYDFKDMSARQWCTGTLPTFTCPQDREAVLQGFARGAIDATGLAASLTKGAVDRALFGEGDTPGEGADVKPEVWNALEAAFYAELGVLSAASEVTDWADSGERFLSTLRNQCLEAFDHHCRTDDPNPLTIRRALRERRLLGIATAGFGKMGQKLRTAFLLPAREVAESKKGRKAARGRASTRITT